MFKLSFKQQVLTGFVVSLIFVLLSAVTSYLSLKSLEEEAKWQTHTHEVINLTERIKVQLANAESSMRGYILTQRPKYLNPYSKNIVSIIPNLEELKNVTADNPLQVIRLNSIEKLIGSKLGIMRETLQVNDSKGKEAALKNILTDKGKITMDNIELLSAQVIQSERKLLDKRILATKAGNDRTTRIVLGSALIIFCLILFLFSYIKRTFDQQKLTEIQIRKNNKRLAQLSIENQQKNWLLSGVAAINEVMRGEQEIEVLSKNIVSEISNYIGAAVGVFFLADEKREQLKQSGSYALQQADRHVNSYLFGEGLIGQVAHEKKDKMLLEVPENYIRITSGLGSATPKCIYLMPILFEGESIAVIELGLLAPPDESTKLFLNAIGESISIAIHSAEARIKLRNLIEQLQQQTEELETQQEELRTTNEELMFKSEQLQASEEELRVQQEELRQTNAELEEKAQQLEERNIAVNQAREAISLKAEELTMSSRYKSEFLANMSHELRTPLNSILILARILKENKPENLNQDQVKYAGVIHNAGSDLLTLINDILDLSKIESGKVDLNIEAIRPQEIKHDMEALFNELAKNKKIEFVTQIASDLPEKLVTDLSRIEQIIKNLLSNAFKFTPEKGRIILNISRADQNKAYFSNQLQDAKDIIALKVQDSGIGIPSDKQKLIFEAFQQADGSTSRKYGGTGLGLSISKELAHLLGGEIQLESLPDHGSTFTLYIPAAYTGEGLVPVAEDNYTKFSLPIKVETQISAFPAPDNEEQVLLIVEDDEVFANVLKDYAMEKGFRPLLAYRGDTGLEMAITEQPDAIILDIMLPVMDGWTILKKLKADPKTKHIPVHMMSAGDERADKAKTEGAIGFLKKPIEKEQLDDAFNLISKNPGKYNFKTVLLIEDQELQSMAVKEDLVNKGIEVVQAFSGQQALDFLELKIFDCIILDLNLPDISGFDLLDKIKTRPAFSHIPVIINTAMELDQAKMAHIMKYTEAMVLKSNKSNNRLIDEVSLFMNKIKKDDHTKNEEKPFINKTILITDDDMRNIFALSSALQDYNLNIVIANHGREAIEKLESDQTIDLVLMDIMMPEMDGYEAMRAIRLKKEFAKLPIIALTAKAMKQDRDKCIEAGANDYISKPVNIDQLLSMMRVWLS